MHTKLHQKWHDIDGVYLVPFLTNKTFHKAHSSTAGLNSVVRTFGLKLRSNPPPSSRSLTTTSHKDS